ncbi:DUF2007 domain-containing protein [Flavobacterium sp. Sd200]|uniref:DUF2007 domain-containing protein n=1 Tax=Flavobacterium sp. Sd200 TaxID=2692211 RepID=UPI001367FE4F|nr:DUF2007 domain-containing protein [Flavobacterium sp. Sd200]MXN92634.1 DUF2007 domain-containing protein [Flavobacterium sp. Sd200]
MENFITAAVFSYPHEITILKHLLQQQGISFYFENETMAGVVPFYTHALGGIKLKVHTNDLDTVLQILQELTANNHLKIV